MSKIETEWVNAYFDHGVDINNRRVFIREIDSESVDKVIKGLYLMETISDDEPCEMFINSPGGEVSETLALYDIMNTLRCPIKTFAYGICMSAAPLLLAAGAPDQRWVAEHVVFMHHDYSAEMEGRGAQLQAEMKYHEQINEIWTRLLVKHSNQDYRFWQSRARKPHDFFFTAEEAIEWGLADSVWNEKN